MAAKRRGTATSNFGVGKRESHDASAFYARFEGPELSIDSQVAAGREGVWNHDASDMAELADGSVALVVTSPPYFVGKSYEQNLDANSVPGTYAEYLDMLTRVFRECVRVLEPGGRVAVNVANLGRKPYRSLSADIIAILQDELGLFLRGEIIWQKSKGAGGNCAWGSFQSAKNPVLRDVTERIIVASKGRFERALSTAERAEQGLPHEDTIGRDEFLDLTLDLWDFPAESAKRVGHPAPFPVELPRRLIELYTFRGDLVLDPFMGSGSTAVAAVQADRRFAGYDLDPAFVELALRRAEETRFDRELAQKAARERTLPPLIQTFRAETQARAERADEFQRRATEDGRRAKDLAAGLLEHCGFAVDTMVVDKKYRGGVEVNFVAQGDGGLEWMFDVSGAFSSTRPGLQRTDTLWKALGKAAVLRAELGRDPERPMRLVLISTDLPKPRSAGHQALVAAHADGLVWDVLELGSYETVGQLLYYASGRGDVPPERLTGYTGPPAPA
jgi:site-specific DNA-methyltransferase (adenine-specific)